MAIDRNREQMTSHTERLKPWYESLRASEPGTIFLHDYKLPMRERLESRRYCGPYQWRPTPPGSGRGFYLASQSFACDAHGSSFDLRLEPANDHLSGCQGNINGYYCDEFQDQTLQPIIARLPHSRGFLAGWTMGHGMASSLDASIYDDAESAAYAAHSISEHDAEREREYQARMDEEDEEDDSSDE